MLVVPQLPSSSSSRTDPSHDGSVRDSGIDLSNSGSLSRIEEVERNKATQQCYGPQAFSTPMTTNLRGRKRELDKENQEISVDEGRSPGPSISPVTGDVAEVPTTTQRGRKKNYTCETCGKAFDRPSLLLRHTYVHTQERPFKCQYCEKGFSTKSAVSTHERIHTGERPYTCEICHRSFTAGSNLIYHINTHSNIRKHECTLCTKKFVTPGDLRKHMYYHTGLWPFKCPECDRGFTTERCLNNHRSIHTGEKPFRCGLCNRSYTTESSLKTHMKSHTNSGNQEGPVAGPSRGFVTNQAVPSSSLNLPPANNSNFQSPNFNPPPLPPPPPPPQPLVLPITEYPPVIPPPSVLLAQTQRMNAERLNRSFAELRLTRPPNAPEAFQPNSGSAFTNIRLPSSPAFVSPFGPTPTPPQRLSSPLVPSQVPITPTQPLPLITQTRNSARSAPNPMDFVMAPPFFPLPSHPPPPPDPMAYFRQQQQRQMGSSEQDEPLDLSMRPPRT